MEELPDRPKIKPEGVTMYLMDHALIPAILEETGSMQSLAGMLREVRDLEKMEPNGKRPFRRQASALMRDLHKDIVRNLNDDSGYAPHSFNSGDFDVDTMLDESKIATVWIKDDKAEDGSISKRDGIAFIWKDSNKKKHISEYRLVLSPSEDLAKAGFKFQEHEQVVIAHNTREASKTEAVRLAYGTEILAGTGILTIGVAATFFAWKKLSNKK